MRKRSVGAGRWPLWISFGLSLLSAHAWTQNGDDADKEPRPVLALRGIAVPNQKESVNDTQHAAHPFAGTRLTFCPHLPCDVDEDKHFLVMGSCAGVETIKGPEDAPCTSYAPLKNPEGMLAAHGLLEQVVPDSDLAVQLTLQRTFVPWQDVEKVQPGMTRGLWYPFAETPFDIIDHNGLLTEFLLICPLSVGDESALLTDVLLALAKQRTAGKPIKIDGVQQYAKCFSQALAAPTEALSQTYYAPVIAFCGHCQAISIIPKNYAFEVPTSLLQQLCLQKMDDLSDCILTCHFKRKNDASPPTLAFLSPRALASFHLKKARRLCDHPLPGRTNRSLRVKVINARAFDLSLTASKHSPPVWKNVKGTLDVTFLEGYTRFSMIFTCEEQSFLEIKPLYLKKDEVSNNMPWNDIETAISKLMRDAAIDCFFANGDEIWTRFGYCQDDGCVLQGVNMTTKDGASQHCETAQEGASS